MKFDFYFVPLRVEWNKEHCSPFPDHKAERRIVASEEQWSELGQWRNAKNWSEWVNHPEPETRRYARIHIDLAPCLDGWEGRLVEAKVNQDVCICHGCGKWLGNSGETFAPQFENCGGNEIRCRRVPRALNQDDILTRTFKTIEGTKAEVYLWVGSEDFVDCLFEPHYGPVLEMDRNKFKNWHIGGTDQTKLDAIKHLVAGTYCEPA